MARSKPDFTPNPRIWTQYQTACRLNKSEQWFTSNRRVLEQIGFPVKDTLLGGWDANLIEAWLDKRTGARDAANIEEQMLEAVRGKDKSSIHSEERC